MKLSSHFTLAEFTESDYADRHGISNDLPEDLLASALATAEMMERIRDALGGKPIHSLSGYRCAAVNTGIGSGVTSDHIKALAVDFKCPEFGTPYAVAKHLSTQLESLGIGQLIHEFGTWVHVSTRQPSNDINRILTISRRGTVVGIERI